MVVTENEQSTLCSFIQWFLAKVSNFMAPSGMFFSWFCFFSRAQLSFKKRICLFIFIWVLITAFYFIVKALLYFMRARV